MAMMVMRRSNKQELAEEAEVIGTKPGQEYENALPGQGAVTVPNSGGTMISRGEPKELGENLL
jgi:hypothetical protein